MTLLREYVTAVRCLLAGETVSTEGRYVKLRDVALDWPPNGFVPLHLGAGGPKSIALTGELADGLVLGGGTSPQEVRDARAIYDEARAGRPGRVTVYLMAVTGADAPARYAAEVEHWGLDPTREVGVAGDAPAIADAVGRWADAGADAVILQPTAGDHPVEYARFVGEQVRPLVV
jgi:alkanesulfonate monooxygenase SsuD/methylene tetrahydromethanopterin reductase-like flavin-dependent oxidoreductase (luciferase family)